MKKPNPHSLSANIATVKNLFYQRNGQPRGYDESVCRLQRAVEQSPFPTETARKFLALNPTDRRAMIRVNAKQTHMKLCLDPAVCAAFEAVRAHAEWPVLREFRMTDEELTACREVKKRRVTEMQTRGPDGAGERKIVTDGDAMILWCDQIFGQYKRGELQKAYARRDLEDIVAVALLLVTGRRSYEIRSGLSRFEQVGDNGYHVKFTGQAKQAGLIDRPESYCIQALLAIHKWLPAYLELFADPYGPRNRQLLREDKAHVVRSKVMQASWRLARVIEHQMLRGQGVKLTAHDLRDCYALAAYTRFDHKNAPFVKFAAAMLGHSETQGALAYMAVHVDGLHERRPQRIVVDYMNRACVADKEPVPMGADLDY